MTISEEILALAAKGAGFTLRWDHDLDSAFWMNGDKIIGLKGNWKPHEDDSDCLHLLCAVTKWGEQNASSWDSKSEVMKDAWVVLSESLAKGDVVAVRLAVTNLAAEIGRTM